MGTAEGVQQEIRFCRSGDGVRIAYAIHGDGPPLIVNTCWLSHLQHDWHSPVWRHFVEGLGRFATVIRYDERGYGLSDRDVSDFSFEARFDDLESVVKAIGLKRFALLGMAQGGPVAIAYAHRHPERVTRLTLHATYAKAERRPDDTELRKTFAQMIRVGWASPDASFRRVFTNYLIPGATEEQMIWVDELQRTSALAESAAAATVARGDADVTDLLPELDLPVLVLHSRGDRMVDFAEARILASSIRHARFVPLDSSNHILLGTEPAWQAFIGELREFLEPDRAFEVPVSRPYGGLTPREIEVTLLAAQGLDNASIADQLNVSVRTVERHFSNVYLKLGLSGRTARAGAVAHILTENT